MSYVVVFTQHAKSEVKIVLLSKLVALKTE